MILKNLGALTRPRNAPTIKEVRWFLSPPRWIKVSAYGKAKGALRLFVCGGIFAIVVHLSRLVFPSQRVILRDLRLKQKFLAFIFTIEIAVEFNLEQTLD